MTKTGTRCYRVALTPHILRPHGAPPFLPAEIDEEVVGLDPKRDQLAYVVVLVQVDEANGRLNLKSHSLFGHCAINVVGPAYDLQLASHDVYVSVSQTQELSNAQTKVVETAQRQAITGSLGRSNEQLKVACLAKRLGRWLDTHPGCQSI